MLNLRSISAIIRRGLAQGHQMWPIQIKGEHGGITGKSYLAVQCGTGIKRMA